MEPVPEVAESGSFNFESPGFAVHLLQYLECPSFVASPELRASAACRSPEVDRFCLAAEQRP